MRYLTLNEILRLHEMIIADSGGSLTLLNLGALQSAVAQPQMTFGGEDLYPTVAEKAAAVAFSIINNHGWKQTHRPRGRRSVPGFEWI